MNDYKKQMNLLYKFFFTKLYVLQDIGGRMKSCDHDIG